jgi:HlyD family secretion protein
LSLTKDLALIEHDYNDAKECMIWMRNYLKRYYLKKWLEFNKESLRFQEERKSNIRTVFKGETDQSGTDFAD